MLEKQIHIHKEPMDEIKHGVIVELICEHNKQFTAIVVNGRKKDLFDLISLGTDGKIWRDFSIDLLDDMLIDSYISIESDDGEIVTVTGMRLVDDGVLFKYYKP